MRPEVDEERILLVPLNEVYTFLHFLRQLYLPAKNTRPEENHEMAQRVAST